MRIASNQDSSIVETNASIAATSPGSRADLTGESWGSDRVATVGGVILSGSQPWGGCPLERIVPRPLAPIANTPLIRHQLRWLVDGGVRSVGICGNGYTDVVRRRLTNVHDDRLQVSDLRIDYFQDLSPRGPAGCARDAGLASPCDVLVVTDGGVLAGVSVEEVVAAHVRTGVGLTVVVSPSAYTGGPRGESMTPVGLYVFNREVLEHVPAMGYQDIKETLVPKLHRAGVAIASYRTKSLSPRVFNVDSYLAVNDWMCSRLCEGDGCEGAGNGSQGAIIDASARIDPSSRVIGPVVVGSGTRIGAGVTLIGPTSIGRDCRIDDGAVIGRSCIWDGCGVDEGVVLDRCIMPSGSTATDRAGVSQRFVVFSNRVQRRVFGNMMG